MRKSAPRPFLTPIFSSHLAVQGSQVFGVSVRKGGGEGEGGGRKGPAGEWVMDSDRLDVNMVALGSLIENTVSSLVP